MMETWHVVNELKGLKDSTSWVVDKIHRTFRYVKNYKHNVEILEDVRGDLKNKICEIQEKVMIGERNVEKIIPAIDKWLKDAEEFSKDDKYWEEFTEKNIKEGDKCCFGVLLCNMRYRYTISKKAVKKAEKARTKLDKIKEHGSNPVTLPVGPPDLGSTPTEFSKSLGSRELSVKRIMAALTDNEAHVIGIHGMGGSGKTTLIEEVARRVEKEPSFDSVVIAEVSQTPIIRQIQAQIAERIGLPLDGITDEDGRARRLRNRLKQLKGKQKRGDETGSNDEEDNDLDNEHTEECDKEENQRERTKEKNKEVIIKFNLLVILDNVWKRLDLNKVGIPFDCSAEFCCKIVLTSRSKEVCKMMGAADNNIFEIGVLDEEEAKLLFRERVGNNVDQEEFKNMENKLLKQCANLPLAVAALGDALKNQDLSVWKRVAAQLENRVASNVGGIHGDLYSILHLSFNFIDSVEKKSFFLLSCLLPMGSSITIEDLLRYGIGLGLFQHVNSLVEAMDQASLWTDELKSSSLLLKDEDEGHVKIHDVVRAAAMVIAAKEECTCHVGALPRWLVDETYRTYTAISMMSDDNHEPLGTKEMPKLQTLILKHSHPSKFPDSFFQGMKNLKVLAMSGMNMPTLPSSITLLGILGTLLLEKCQLEDISAIGDLKRLLVLSLRNSSIQELPGEIGELSKLRLLDITGCTNLKRISANVLARLTLLEGLYMNDSFGAWVIDNHDIERSQASFQELKALQYLKVLEVQIPTIEHFPEDLLFDDLPKFDISIGPRNTKFRDLYPASQILVLSKIHASSLKQGPIALLRKAESLAISRVEGLKNVAYDLDQDGFNELRSLYVLDCSEVEYIISTPPLHRCRPFPKLDKLALYTLKKLKEICHGQACADFFCQLKKIKLFSLPGLLNVWGWKGPLKGSCSLRFVIVNGCDTLEYIFSESVAQKLEKLEELQVVECHRITEILSSEVEGSDCTVLHSLRVLDFYDVPNLGTFWSARADNVQTAKPFFNDKIRFPALESIKLKGIGKIEQLWVLPPVEEDPEGATFSQLKNLLLFDLPMLQHVWRQEASGSSSSFHNLKVLKIGGCEGLLSLCPPSVASVLVQLEHLEIERNKNMEAILMKIQGADNTCNTANVMVKFPKLQNLVLYDLTNLKCFCHGDVILDFPSLKTLQLRRLPEMTAFLIPESKISAVSMEQSRVVDDVIEIQEDDIIFHMFYSQKVSFPSLEGLQISYCHKMKCLFAASTYLCLPELRKLDVRDCKEIQAIVTKEPRVCEAELVVSFPKLNVLELYMLPNLVSCIVGGYAAEWHSLERLEITGCHNITTFSTSKLSAFGNSEPISVEPFFKQKDIFPAMKKLEMDDLKLLKQIWDNQLPDESFRQLEILEVKSCPKLVTVIPFNILQRIQNLKELIVKDSGDVEELFELECRDSLNTNIYDVVALFQVRMLVLVFLPKLKHIPWTMFWSLSSVRIRALGGLTRLFPAPAGENTLALLPHLQNMEELTLADCNMMEDLFQPGELGGIQLLPQLRKLKMANLYKLKYIEWFKNLSSFTAYRLNNWKHLFSSSTARFLNKLEEVYVEYCNDMEEIIALKEKDVSSNSMVLTFPRLKHLKLYDLPCLRHFLSKESASVHFPSLEVVRITSCHNMETFVVGRLTTPKLHEVVVDQNLQDNNDLNAILEQVRKDKVQFILQSVEIYEDDETKELELGSDSDQWFDLDEEIE